MKRYLHSLAAAMIFMLPLASCDKDNNGDDPTPTPTPNPTTPTAQLSSIEITEKETGYSDYFSKYIFQYDENNKIKSIKRRSTGFDSGEYELTQFSWNPFSMTINGNKINATLSSAGYLISAEPLESSNNAKFEYDNHGHLTRQLYFDTDYYNEIVYTWENDLLVEIVNTTKYSKYNDTVKVLSAISYGEDQNKTGIWPASFWLIGYLWYQVDDGTSCACLSQTGLLGVAPTRLPISSTEIEIEYENGIEKRRYENKCKISNQLDSKGRLSSESMEATTTGTSNKTNYKFKYTYR